MSSVTRRAGELETYLNTSRHRLFLTTRDTQSAIQAPGRAVLSVRGTSDPSHRNTLSELLFLGKFPPPFRLLSASFPPPFRLLCDSASVILHEWWNREYKAKSATFGDGICVGPSDSRAFDGSSASWT